jgi:hypothetical protein
MDVCWILLIVFFIILYTKCKGYYLTYIEKNVINICVTTIPSRLNTIIPILKSYLNQSIPFNKLFLCIPYISLRKKKAYVIPKELLIFVKLHSEKIIIIRCKDYGPGTKLLGYLEKSITNDNELIILGDDDRIVQQNLIELLLNKHRTHSNTVIAGIVGKQQGPVRQSKVPWGASGILIPRNLIKDDIFEVFENLKEWCMFVDDMFWYKYFHELHKYRFVQADGIRLSDETNGKDPLFLDETHKRGGDTGLQIKCYDIVV